MSRTRADLLGRGALGARDTGVLGAAVGHGLYEIAVLVSLLMLLKLLLLTPIEHRLDSKRKSDEP